MRVVYQRCCGLDVHKKTVVACLLTPAHQEVRTFVTMTAGLLQLADWLLTSGVTHVAMESTGVYWKPIYNLLEGLGMTLLVVNAQHIKAVPGRKTDGSPTCCGMAWCGGASSQTGPGRELRELVRYRQSLIRQRASVVLRIQKVLEGADIKLSSVASDIVGVTGRAVLQALVDGSQDAKAPAALAKGRLKNKQTELEAAREGLVGPHQRYLLGSQLRQLNFLAAEIGAFDREISQRMEPQGGLLEQLDRIPGVGRHTGAELLAELGTDMTRFPRAAHLASWARICPGNNESAGKRKSGPTGSGMATRRVD